MNLIWYFLLAAAGFTVFCFIVAGFGRFPQFALVVAGLPVLTLAEFQNSFNIATIAGVNVAFIDVFSAALFAVFLRKISNVNRMLAAKVFLAFVALVGISLVAGAARFGPNLSANEARQFLWTISCLLWSTTLDWRSVDFQRRIMHLLVVFGWMLVAAAAVHVYLRGFATYGDDFVESSGDIRDSRILVSGQALILVFSLLAAIALARQPRTSRWWAVSAVVFFLVVLLSQQRTVWVVAFIVLGAGIILDRRRRASDVLWALGIVWGLSALFVSGLVDGVMDQLVQASQNTRTYDGRSQGWTALVAQASDRGAFTVMFGEPFGAGYARVELGRLVGWNPHNWYLNIFLRVGVIGLLLYCSAMVIALFGLLWRRQSLFLILVALGTGVYSWTYNSPWYAALILGGAFALSSAPRPSRYTVSAVQEPAVAEGVPPNRLPCHEGVAIAGAECSCVPNRVGFHGGARAQPEVEEFI